jgi:hypothetical protein
MTQTLLAGEILTTTTDADGTCTVRRFDPSSPATAYDTVSVPVSTTAAFGPFTARRYYDVITTSENVTVAISQSDALAASSEATGPLAITPTTVPVSVVQTIPENSQAVVFGTLTVRGILTVLGTLLVPATPTA